MSATFRLGQQGRAIGPKAIGMSSAIVLRELGTPALRQLSCFRSMGFIQQRPPELL